MRKQLDEILDILDSGETHIDEILGKIGVSKNTARKYLNLLIDEKKVIRVKSGLYDLHEDYRPLTPLENRKIIKDLILFQKDILRIYRKDLNILLEQKNPDPNETQRLLDCIRVLSTSIDKLMKRWNLLTQGYDTNARQAQEDAKKKTVEREKREHAEAPLSEQIQEVGHYHPDVKEVWDTLPEQEKKDKTV